MSFTQEAINHLLDAQENLSHAFKWDVAINCDQAEYIQNNIGNTIDFLKSMERHRQIQEEEIREKVKQHYAEVK